MFSLITFLNVIVNSISYSTIQKQTSMIKLENVFDLICQIKKHSNIKRYTLDIRITLSKEWDENGVDPNDFSLQHNYKTAPNNAKRERAQSRKPLRLPVLQFRWRKFFAQQNKK